MPQIGWQNNFGLGISPDPFDPRSAAPDYCTCSLCYPQTQHCMTPMMADAGLVSLEQVSGIITY